MPTFSMVEFNFDNSKLESVTPISLTMILFDNGSNDSIITAIRFPIISSLKSFDDNDPGKNASTAPPIFTKAL